MRRAVVCVATTSHYQRGMQRLYDAMNAQGHSEQRCWLTTPPTSPPHSEIPYAFKAHAIQAAADEGFDALLWADACIYPVRDMKPLWERIESEGYWICRNGWRNDEWTADSAYPDLFPGVSIGIAREANMRIPHVVATSFGISLRHDVGQQFLAEYLRLAKTRAFCGPWTNANKPGAPHADGVRCAPCGPPTTLGHRHDQTIASVIAFQLGMKLVDPPEIFAYGSAGGRHDERTILLADGSYA